MCRRKGKEVDGWRVSNDTKGVQGMKGLNSMEGQLTPNPRVTDVGDGIVRVPAIRGAGHPGLFDCRISAANAD